FAGQEEQGFDDAFDAGADGGGGVLGRRGAFVEFADRGVGDAEGLQGLANAVHSFLVIVGSSPLRRWVERSASTRRRGARGGLRRQQAIEREAGSLWRRWASPAVGWSSTRQRYT